MHDGVVQALARKEIELTIIKHLVFKQSKLRGGYVDNGVSDIWNLESSTYGTAAVMQPRSRATNRSLHRQSLAFDEVRPIERLKTGDSEALDSRYTQIADASANVENSAAGRSSPLHCSFFARLFKKPIHRRSAERRQT
jgi:hypothetical protein